MSSSARKQKAEMNGSSVGIALSPGGLAAAECTGSQSRRRFSGGFAAGPGIGWSRNYELGASANGRD